MFNITIHEIISDVFYVIASLAVPYAMYLARRFVKIKVADSKATMLLLRGQIILYHKQCVDRGFVTRKGLDNIIEMYDMYMTLGGNGFIERLINDLKSMPFEEQGGVENFDEW